MDLTVCQKNIVFKASLKSRSSKNSSVFISTELTNECLLQSPCFPSIQLVLNPQTNRLRGMKGDRSFTQDKLWEKYIPRCLMSTLDQSHTFQSHNKWLICINHHLGNFMNTHFLSSYVYSTCLCLCVYLRVCLSVLLYIQYTHFSN